MRSDGPSVRGWMRSLDRRSVAIAVTVSVIPAIYLSWLVADLGLRAPGFWVGWMGTILILLRRSRPRGMIIRGLWVLAGLTFLTPGFLVLPFLLNASRYGITDASAFVFTESLVVTIVGFTVLAAIPALIATWARRTA